MKYVPCLVAFQALVTFASLGLHAGEANPLETRDQRVGQHCELGSRFTGKGEETSTTEVETVDCDCEDCNCLDPLICKNGDCKSRFIVMFSASWCGPCQKMYPVVESLRKNGYTVYVFDIDKFPSAAKEAKIKAVPTFLIYDKGQEEQRLIGVQTEDDLVRAFGPKPEPLPEPALPNPDYDLGTF